MTWSNKRCLIRFDAKAAGRAARMSFFPTWIIHGVYSPENYRNNNISPEQCWLEDYFPLSFFRWYVFIYYFFGGYNMILLYIYFGFGPVKRKFLFTCMKDYFYRLYLRLSQRDGGYNYITVLNVYYKDLQGWRWRRNKLWVSNRRFHRSH